MDSLGAALAEYIACLTNRQAIILFGLSTIKTVDDHCGYRLPWDPMQLICRNNADYHDIHHQVLSDHRPGVYGLLITIADYRYQIQLQPALVYLLGRSV